MCAYEVWLMRLAWIPELGQGEMTNSFDRRDVCEAVTDFPVDIMLAWHAHRRLIIRPRTKRTTHDDQLADVIRVMVGD